MDISRISKQACIGKSWYLCMWDYYFFFFNSIKQMCQFYNCFGVTFVLHFFECVHTLMINWYEKLLSEYFIAWTKKHGWNILYNMLNILIRLVLIGHIHHFWGVVRDYRCWGPTRWALSLFVLPRVPPPVCLSFSFASACLFLLLCQCWVCSSQVPSRMQSIPANLRESESFAKPELFGWTALRLRG